MKCPRAVLLSLVLLLSIFAWPFFEGKGADAYRDGGWNSNYSLGQKLFATHCAACHGKNGEGGVGVPLNLQSFLSVAPPGYIRKTIFYGRLPRTMIAYGAILKKKEIEAIATFVRGWQVSDYKGLDIKRVAGSVSNGKLLFDGMCIGCHGLNGLGGPQVGGGHVTNAIAGYPGPSLNNQGFLKSSTDGYIKATLMSGRVGTPMGSYLKGKQGFVELREEEINDLVAYIRSWEKQGGGPRGPWRSE
ncbi:MAG: c-type cytochrome [Nitrospinaceae bacterium]|nr:c-type cytochrome [Nitrospinaceae bacterium]MBT7857925.1 c-type cytochrome [Nitrospinaceae bacterium]